MFFNFSNHSSTKWSEAQRVAAIALGGEIIDISMPIIPPEADAAFVNDAAQELVRGILKNFAPSSSAALVVGEYTLTYSLVRILGDIGIRCYATTTRREVTEIEFMNRTEKQSVFHFVQFRGYRNSIFFGFDIGDAARLSKEWGKI
jgi:hypothetical protein